MSKILPNTYQAFNVYVDQAMELLTGEEVKCLDFATRHILGWQDKLNTRRAHISISRFVEGTVLKDGTRYGGTGMNRAAVIKALDELHRFGLVVKIGKPTEKGQEFELGESPNWDLMLERKAEKDAANRKRTAKGTAQAQAKRQAAKGGTSDAPAQSGTSHEPQPVRPTHQQEYVPRTGTGTSDVRNQNHLQSQPQNQSQIGAGNPVFDRNKVRDCVAWTAFGIKDMSKLPSQNDLATLRLNQIVAWLRSRYTGMPEAQIAARVVEFKQTWRSRRKITMPKKPDVFAEQWIEWEQESLPPPDTSGGAIVTVGRKIGGNDAGKTV